MKRLLSLVTALALVIALAALLPDGALKATAEDVYKQRFSVNLSNADVNGDGKVDILDVLTIRQSLAGWSVTLK